MIRLGGEVGLTSQNVQYVCSKVGDYCVMNDVFVDQERFEGDRSSTVTKLV